MLVKILLAISTLVAVIGSCHGSYKQQREADDLFRKTIVKHIDPATQDETFAALEKMRTVSGDDFLISIIMDFVKNTPISEDKCDAEGFNVLNHLYQWLVNQSEHEGFTEISRSVRVFIDALIKLCKNELEARIDEGLGSLTDRAITRLDNLGRSVVNPLDTITPSKDGKKLPDSVFLESITKFVMDTAGEDSIRGHDWSNYGKVQLVEGKYENAYKEFVIEPCRNLVLTLKPAVNIAISLEKQGTLKDRVVLLLKEMRICEYAWNSCLKSFGFLKKARGQK